MAFKFGESGHFFIIEFGSAEVGIKTLVRGSIKMVITSTANGSFDKIGIGNAGVVAITRQNSDAVQVGGCNFIVALFDGIKGFSGVFNVIWSERSTMSAESKDCSSGILWAINDVFLARITDMCEDEIVNCRANAGMGVRNLFGPKIKDLACQGGDITNDAEVVHEGIELSASGNKVSWVRQFAEIGIFGILQKGFGQIFNGWVSEVSSG